MQTEIKMSTLTPLQMMQRFYHDYNGKTRPFATVDNTVCKYARKKSNDTNKMTKFLLNIDQKQKGATTMTNTQYRKAISTQHGSTTPNRYKSNISQIQKRSYFKSIYSQSHPFLVSQHKIHEKNINQIKGMKTQPIQPMAKAMLYENFKLMNPVQNRKSVQQMKQTMIRIKQFKRQKMQRIRYNFIFNNSFRNHKQVVNYQNQNNSRIRLSDSNTKQRIFPSNAYLKL